MRIVQGILVYLIIVFVGLYLLGHDLKDTFITAIFGLIGMLIAIVLSKKRMK